MKNFHTLVLAMFALIAVNACAPIYKCGEPIPEKKSMFWGKRLKTVVNERDTLCSHLSASRSQTALLEKDTTALNTEIKQLTIALDSTIAANLILQNSLTDLHGNYNALQNEKISQAEQLNRALKQKSDELNEKEQLLSEREKNLRELRQTIARQDSVSKRLKDVLHKALLGFKSDELSVETKNGKVYVSMSDKLLFKSGSAAVESKGAEALKAVAEVLLKNPDIEILIEGHTDNIPIKTAVFKDNWDLSVARATSIVRILADDYKVPATRLTASGRGEFFPKADNSTPEGRAQNRRTEIILSPNLDAVMQILK